MPTSQIGRTKTHDEELTSSEPSARAAYLPRMSFYPAVIVSVDAQAAVVRLEETGQQIVFPHAAHNALPPEARQVGAKGFISFPKAPAVFTLQAA
jgi:hypothetical protein